MGAAALTVVSFGREDIVTPTISVTARSAGTTGQAGELAPNVQNILAARTRLMDDRKSSGPEAFPPLSGGDQALAMDPGVTNGRQLVQSWECNTPPPKFLPDQLLRNDGDIAGAMWSGQVDRNWAKEHHSIWYREAVEDERGLQRPQRRGGDTSVPAE